jgi:hypothetical protein
VSAKWVKRSRPTVGRSPGLDCSALVGRISLPVANLDTEAVGIEDEHGPVTRLVAVPLRRELDLDSQLLAALIGFVDLLGAVHEYGKVLDPNVVVAVLAPVGRSQPQILVTEAEVDDLLAAPVGGERKASLAPSGPSRSR